MRQGAKNPRHGAENVRHVAENVWHGTKNVQHGGKNVRHEEIQGGSVWFQDALEELEGKRLLWASVLLKCCILQCRAVQCSEFIVAQCSVVFNAM